MSTPNTVILIDDNPDKVLEIAAHFFPLLWKEGIATEVFLFGNDYEDECENEDMKKWQTQRDFITHSMVSYFKTFCQELAVIENDIDKGTLYFVTQNKHLIGWKQEANGCITYDLVLKPENYTKNNADFKNIDVGTVDWIKLTKGKVVLLDLALRRGDCDDSPPESFASIEVIEIITVDNGAKKIFPLTGISSDSPIKNWEEVYNKKSLPATQTAKVASVRPRNQWIFQSTRDEVVSTIKRGFIETSEEMCDV